MKTKLRQKGTKLSWKRFFQVNIRKYRDIKFVTTERRRNYLVSELNYHTKNLLTENVLAVEMKKTQILMKKSVYLSYLKTMMTNVKKANRTKKCVTKGNLKRL